MRRAGNTWPGHSACPRPSAAASDGCDFSSSTTSESDRCARARRTRRGARQWTRRRRRTGHRIRARGSDVLKGRRRDRGCAWGGAAADASSPSLTNRSHRAAGASLFLRRVDLLGHGFCRRLAASLRALLLDGLPGLLRHALPRRLVVHRELSLRGSLRGLVSRQYALQRYGCDGRCSPRDLAHDWCSTL